MRPLKLELSGFMCFREPTEVSFEELTLFAISGATGSGKSAILDAQVYALYGQTPRLGKQGLAALMNPNTTQLTVGFTFETRSGIYRVVRSMSRGKSNVSSQARIEAQMPDATWKQLPETGNVEINNRLIDLVGLDYDNFTRAVLLPQGAFSEFLHGTQTQRADLLIKLLGLERIRAIQQEAGQIAKAAQNRAKFISEQLEQDYADSTPERLEALRQERVALEKQQATLTDTLARLAEELTAGAALKELLDRRKSVQERLTEFAAQAPRIEEDRQALRRAQDAVLIMPQLEHSEERQRKLETTRMQAATLKRTLTQRREALDTAQKAAAAAEKAAEGIPDITLKLETLASLGERVKRLVSLGGKMSLAAQADRAVRFSEDDWERLNTLRLQIPNLKRAETTLADAEKAHATAQKNLTATRLELEELTKQQATLKDEGQKIREVHDAAEAAYRQAEKDNAGLALRRELKEGDLCPVCERPIKELPPLRDDANLGSLKARWDAANETLLKLRDDFNSNRTKVANAQRWLSERETALEGSRAQQKEAKAALETLQATFKAYGDSADSITRATEGQRTLLLADLAASIMREAGGEDPEKATAKLRAERKALEEGQKRSQEALRGAETAHASAQQEAAVISAQTSGLEEDVKNALENLTKALATADFATPDDARRAALSDSKRESITARIESYGTQKRLAEEKDVQLQAEIAGRSLDESLYEALKTQHAAAERDLKDATQRYGRIGGDIESLEQKISRVSELREEMKALEERAGIYHQINVDLQGRNFQDYLVTRVQEQLAYRASDIMNETTRGRYDLRLKEGEFHVLDAWHSGELRRAKTLSGGETFMASLALALALSDTVAGNATLGALFLDEGFGTLDSDTLEAVAGVLESLTEGGRMVGLITHVSELSNRMPERLLVERGAGGSRVQWDVGF